MRAPGLRSVVCLLAASVRLTAAQVADRSNNLFPQWTHDGTRLSFTSDRDGDPEIYVMNTDGSKLVRLTGTPR